MNVSALAHPASVYVSESRRPMAARPVETEVKPSATAAGDNLQISPTGRLLEMARQSFMGGAGADGKVTMDEIQQHRDRSCGELKGILAETTATLGIDPKRSFSISRDAAGQVSVQGELDESQREALTKALNGNAAFQQAYGAASGAGTVAAAGLAHSEFAAAYEQNPVQAVRTHASLFDASWATELTYQSGEVLLSTHRV